MKVTHETYRTVTTFVVGVDEAVEASEVAKLLAKALTPPNSTQQVEVTAEPEPTPYQRQLPSVSGKHYALCPKCGNRVVDYMLPKHMRSLTCKRNRARLHQASALSTVAAPQQRQLQSGKNGK